MSEHAAIEREAATGTPPGALPATPTGGSRRPSGGILSGASMAFCVALWWLLTSGTGLVSPLYFPSPLQVVERLGNLWPTLALDSAMTLVRVVASWLIGSILGVAAGLLMARSYVARHVMQPIIEAVRPVPPVALVPFVILWFGIGDLGIGKIVLGSLSCFMVMVVNTVVSSNNIRPVFLRAARSLGASENVAYRTVILPAILPELVSGLRIGAALAFAVIVAAEMIGAEAGLGRLIMLASRTLDTPVILLGTVVIGIEAYVLDRIVRLVSLRSTRWADRDG